MFDHVKSLLEEAKHPETTPARLEEIWKQTTSIHVRKQVVNNPNVSLKFLTEPKVFSIVVDEITQSGQVELILLFDDAQKYFNYTQIRVIECIKAFLVNPDQFVKDIKDGTRELSYDFGWSQQRSFKAFLKLLLKVSPVSDETKLEILHSIFSKGGIPSEVALENLYGVKYFYRAWVELEKRNQGQSLFSATDAARRVASRNSYHLTRLKLPYRF